jgi:protein-tyrosine-phosphatase
MAEGICRKYFADFLGCSVDELGRFGYIINSVGIFAHEDAPASCTAVEVCGKHGIDLNDHRSQPLTLDAIEQSDLIYVMSRSHRDSIVRLSPSAAKKCFVLDENGDIQDPVGLDRDAYEKCFVQIQNAIIGRIKELL